MNMQRQKAGFTLVELLVVIGILAVLAGMLFPVFARAREKGRSTVCQSNLRQLGIAFAMYAEDYDGKFPWGVDAADWYCPQIWNGHPQWQVLIPSMYFIHYVLSPYTGSGSIWQCPSDTGYDLLEDENIPLNGLPTAFEAFGSSYMWRTELSFSQTGPDQMPDPAGANTLMDSHGRFHGSDSERNRRWNQLYGDGHVKSVNRQGFDAAWTTPVK